MAAAAPASGAELAAWGGHDESVRAVLFTPEGLVSGGEDGFLLVHGEDGAELHRTRLAGPITALAISPDHRFLAVGSGKDTAIKTDPLLEPPLMPLQLSRANAKRVEGRATQDLTAHPWAGLKVRMTLVARDQAGQAGMSAPYEFILPERKFTKPLAAFMPGDGLVCVSEYRLTRNAGSAGYMRGGA